MLLFLEILLHYLTISKEKQTFYLRKKKNIKWTIHSTLFHFSSILLPNGHRILVFHFV
jgi:hypothetical protein